MLAGNISNRALNPEMCVLQPAGFQVGHFTCLIKQKLNTGINADVHAAPFLDLPHAGHVASPSPDSTPLR